MIAMESCCKVRFAIRKVNDKTTVYTGTINGQKGDFSDFINNYGEDTNFYITCEGVKSYNFKVANNLLNSYTASPDTTKFYYGDQDNLSLKLPDFESLFFVIKKFVPTEVVVAIFSESL